MTHSEILESARKLRPVDLLHLIDELLESLDESDPAIEAAWLAEAQNLLAAYERGELPLADMAPLLEQYR